MTLPTDAQIQELLVKATATNDRKVIYVCKIALDQGVTHRSAKQIADAKRRVGKIMVDAEVSSSDFYMTVASWCERHDNHPAEGWLALVLDGTIKLDEFKQAIFEDREPKESR